MAYGTGSVLMEEVLTLNADGTGVLASRSLMRGSETIPVRWRHRGAGELALALLFEGQERLDAEDAWEIVRYRSVEIPNEGGGLTAVLCDVGDKNFGPLGGPLEFIRDVD